MKKIFLSMLVVVLLVGVCYAEDIPRGIFIPLPRGITYSDRIVYVFLKWVDYSDVWQMFENIQTLKYDRIVINLFSFGGSVFDALAIVGLLEEQERQGKTIVIKASGIVASAGLIIMMAGTPGHRFIDRNTFIMFHESQTFKMFAIESVSDQEEQAKISRKIQNSINKFISKKTKLTEEKLCELIKKKELWVDAWGALEYGFADKIMGEE